MVEYFLAKEVIRVRFPAGALMLLPGWQSGYCTRLEPAVLTDI